MTRRAAIIAALISRLKTLKVSNGYSSNAGNAVYDSHPENLQAATVPMLNVRDGSETVEELGSGRGTDHKLSVDVIGTVSNGVSTISDARALLGDIAKCLMNPTDRTLGGACDSISMSDGGTIQLEQATDGTRASVSLSLSVLYRTTRGDWSVS